VQSAAVPRPAFAAAHLAACIPGGEIHDTVRLEKFLVELAAAAGVIPGHLLTRAETEGTAGMEGECGIFAKVKVERSVSHFYRAVLHRIQHLQTGN
jgi:hypothetical protein